MTHIPVKRILVPMDLSRPTEALEGYAIALAKQLSAELLFFSVIDSPTSLKLIESHPSSGTAESAGRDTGFREKIVDDAEVLLRGMVERAAAASVRALGHAIVSEKVGHEVLAEARQREADLIVLATDEHSLLWSFLFGDSSEEISHLAPCPVLTIRPANEDE